MKSKVKAKKKDTKGDMLDIPPMPKDEEVTRQIQFRCTPPTNGKGVFQSTEAEFDSAEKARRYWDEFTKNDPMKEMSQNGRTLGLTSGAQIVTNYDIRRIWKEMEPPKLLPDVFLRDRREYKRPDRMPADTAPTSTPKPEKEEKPSRKEKTASGALIPLKAICRDINVEPREARVKLRAAVKKKVIQDPGGRWEWPSNEVEQIKKIIA